MQRSKQTPEGIFNQKHEEHEKHREHEEHKEHGEHGEKNIFALMVKLGHIFLSAITGHSCFSGTIKPYLGTHVIPLHS